MGFINSCESVIESLNSIMQAIFNPHFLRLLNRVYAMASSAANGPVFHTFIHASLNAITVQQNYERVVAYIDEFRSVLDEGYEEFVIPLPINYVNFLAEFMDLYGEMKGYLQGITTLAGVAGERLRKAQQLLTNLRLLGHQSFI